MLNERGGSSNHLFNSFFGTIEFAAEGAERERRERGEIPSYMPLSVHFADDSGRAYLVAIL